MNKWTNKHPRTLLPRVMSKRGELKSHVFAWWVHMMTKREIMGASRLVIIIEWKWVLLVGRHQTRLWQLPTHFKGSSPSPIIKAPVTSI
jgi:hypothetical protein